jgi:hypothetical protein
MAKTQTNVQLDSDYMINPKLLIILEQMVTPCASPPARAYSKATVIRSVSHMTREIESTTTRK